ncbi:MAG: caspase family protein [Caldilineaceae bacterium]|nr:caspase family protein [Caldilineaceae bacterium]
MGHANLHFPEQAALSPKYQPYYQRSWAVVIGIDAYRSPHSRLDNACNDARAMATLLRAYRFDQVVAFYDTGATRAALMHYLGEELPKQVGPDDRIVFFFAGHGLTQSDASGQQHGYLVPYDSHRLDEYIDMVELHQLCHRLRAKHILLLLDCCFSGVAAMKPPTQVASPFAPGDLPQAAAFLRWVTQRRAWQVLTAGAADEMVAERGVQAGRSAFTAALITGLKGAADDNADGLITASDLATYVCLQLAHENRLRGLLQTPFFACLSGAASGDFVFETHQLALTEPEPAQLATPAQAVWRAPQLLISLLWLGALVSCLFALVALLFANVPLHTNPLDPNSATTTPEMALMTAMVLMVVAAAVGGVAYALQRGLIGQPAWQEEVVRQYKQELQRLIPALHQAPMDDKARQYAQWLTEQTWRRVTDKRRQAALLFYLYQQKLIVNKAVISLRDLDLSGLDLAKRNWRALDLSYAQLQKTNLSKTSLTEANLQGADLSKVSLWQADLRDAALDDAIVDEANLSGATITERQLLSTRSHRNIKWIDGTVR